MSFATLTNVTHQVILIKGEVSNKGLQFQNWSQVVLQYSGNFLMFSGRNESNEKD